MAKRKQIILDFSANTFKNDPEIIDRAVREIACINTGKHEVIFKTQLFKEAGKNVVCEHKMYDYLHTVCAKRGYGCTASVFDHESLEFLYSYHKKRLAEKKTGIPFIKIANNPDLYHLINEIPRAMPVYASMGYDDFPDDIPIYSKDKFLRCVSKYPAKISDYFKIMQKVFSDMHCHPVKGYSDYVSISDHTIGLELFETYEDDLEVWEKHLILDDSDGLDAGPFAITPQELAEIL